MRFAGCVDELVLAACVTVTLSVTDRLLETVTSCETEREGEADEGAEVMLALALPDEAAEDALDADEEAVEEVLVIKPDKSAACATASEERRVCEGVKRRQLTVAAVEHTYASLTASAARQLTLIASYPSECELVDRARVAMRRFGERHHPSTGSRMADEHAEPSAGPSTVPAAYPRSAQPSPSPSPIPRSSRRRSPWQNGSSFYLTGAGAPPILNTRRAPPFKGRSSIHVEQRPSARLSSPTSLPPSPSPVPSPPVLLTEGVCCCCGTALKYPRSSPNFRCTICETVNDLSAEARRGKASDGAFLRPSLLRRRRLIKLPVGVPVPDATPETEDEMLRTIERLEARQRGAEDDLVGRLSAVGLSGSLQHGNDEDDPEDLLLAQLATAFTNLPSLDASFRRTRSTSHSNLPQQSTLSRLYELVKLRPAALKVLRDQVDAILRRPGPTLAEGDGGWVIALIEVSLTRSCCVYFWLTDETSSAQSSWRTLRSRRKLGGLCSPASSACTSSALSLERNKG